MGALVRLVQYEVQLCVRIVVKTVIGVGVMFCLRLCCGEVVRYYSDIVYRP